MTLLGAHTIGGKGFGGPLEFDNAYYKTLVAVCAGGPLSCIIHYYHMPLESHNAGCRTLVEVGAGSSYRLGEKRGSPTAT